MPIRNHAYLHPSLPKAAITGGSIIPDRKSPNPMPAETIPVARPRFLITNHAAGSAIMGT